VTSRFVAVLADLTGHATPPGIDPAEFGLALLEDTYEVAAGLDLVTPALVAAPPVPPELETIIWPGTPIVPAEGLAEAFTRLHDLGAEQAAIIAADAPDLPPLLIGKLFRALSHAPAAACSAGSGLVALAVWLPLQDWLRTALATVDLDTPDAFARLRAAAPHPGLVQSGPGWHRLRRPADVALLDPGLEGWDNTRVLLGG
jgi:hypothetical protein